MQAGRDSSGRRGIEHQRNDTVCQAGRCSGDDCGNGDRHNPQVKKRESRKEIYTGFGAGNMSQYEADNTGENIVVSGGDVAGGQSTGENSSKGKSRGGQDAGSG